MANKTEPDMVSQAALDATFTLARKGNDPLFRAYARELTGQDEHGRTAVVWVVALPGETIESVMLRCRQTDEWPKVLALPDESQPFGYRMLVIGGPDTAAVAGWQSTLAIHADPELHAALTRSA